MNNNQKILGLVALIMMLSGCNSGSTAVSTPPSPPPPINSDVQQIAVSASGESQSFSLVGSASNCRTQTTCAVQLTYSASRVFAGPLGLTPVGSTAGYTSTIGTCAAANANSQTCNFTITNSSLINVQQLGITFNNISTVATINIGNSGS